ncbi:MAG: hypothetical protein ACYSR0_13110 [Planctomycetota bacterium]|jgi:hypothetical protein
MKAKEVKKLDNTAKFLLESGLLWRINREILHPLGLALEVIIDDSGHVKFGDSWDYREDPEGILYDTENMLVGAQKWERYKQEKGSRQLFLRKSLLKFEVQPIEDTGGEDIFK